MRERLMSNKKKREISEKRPYKADDYDSFYDLGKYNDILNFFPE